MTQAEFLERVEMVGDCWLWTGSIDPNGYGRVGKSGYAHRVAYELFVGPIPKGKHLDHPKGCPKHCCNPFQLKPVTPSTNAALVYRRKVGQMPKKQLRVARWLHRQVGMTA